MPWDGPASCFVCLLSCASKGVHLCIYIYMYIQGLGYMYIYIFIDIDLFCKDIQAETGGSLRAQGCG